MNEQRAFTLIELLVVISIISLLSSVVFSSLNSAREKGRIAAAQKFSSALHHAIGDQLVGEWLFNDDTADDSSGFGNDGGISGAVPGDGFSSRAMFFDGSSDIDLGGDVYITAQTSFTYSAWVIPTETGASNMAIIGGRYGDRDSFSITSSGKVKFRGDDTEVVSNGMVPWGKWSHVAVVYEYDSANPMNTSVSLYVDGKLDRTGPPISWHMGVFDDWGSGNRWVGWESRFNYYYTGGIDDVRIYQKAFKASDIQKVYAEGLGEHHVLASK